MTSTYSRIRTLVAGAAVVTALGTLAACSGGGEAAHGGGHATTGSGGGAPAVSGTLTALRTAAAKTGRADSAKVDGTTSVDKVSMAMKGQLSWAHGLTGDVDITTAGGASSSVLQKLGGNGSYQARYLSDAMYVDMGPTIAQADGGKPWLKYGYSDLAKLMGSSGTAMQDEFQNANPTRSVQMIIGSGDVKAVGSESVRGVRATHYQGTVDVSKLVGSQSGLDPATAERVRAQLKEEGVTTDRIDVWVDGHGLLVKKSERATMSSGSITSTAYYSDYGVPVSVTAPPAAQTMDITQMMGQDQSGSA